MPYDNLSNGTAMLYNQHIHTVHVPEKHRTKGEVTPDFVAEAVTYLHRDGVVVLANAIEKAHLDSLDAILGKEAFEIAADPAHHFNFGKHTRNMDQAPPLQRHLMFDDIWNNAFAVAVLKAMLGGDIVCHYANGNTALQAEGRQPVHSDIDRPHPLFPFAYAVNIPLVDMSPENGSTELWLGTHRESCIDQHIQPGYLQIKPALLDARRKHSPPIQPSTEKGSVIIRDIRLWHAGMPNQTPMARCMLAFVMQPKWFMAPSAVLIPSKLKDLVERWREETGLEYKVEWVDGEVDHKKVKSDDVDFSTANRRMLQLEELMHWPAH